MEKSPCLTCPIHMAGFSKKNEPACTNCEGARLYSDQFGPPDGYPMPIEHTVLGMDLQRQTKINPPDSVVIGEWRDAYEAVRRICKRHDFKTMDLRGEKTENIMAARREIIAELTAMDIGTQRIANICGIEISVVYYHQARMKLKKISGYCKSEKTVICNASMPSL